MAFKGLTTTEEKLAALKCYILTYDVTYGRPFSVDKHNNGEREHVPSYKLLPKETIEELYAISDKYFIGTEPRSELDEFSQEYYDYDVAVDYMGAAIDEVRRIGTTYTDSDRADWIRQTFKKTPGHEQADFYKVWPRLLEERLCEPYADTDRTHLVAHRMENEFNALFPRENDPNKILDAIIKEIDEPDKYKKQIDDIKSIMASSEEYARRRTQTKNDILTANVKRDLTVLELYMALNRGDNEQADKSIDYLCNDLANKYKKYDVYIPEYSQRAINDAISEINNKHRLREPSEILDRILKVYPEAESVLPEDIARIRKDIPSRIQYAQQIYDNYKKNTPDEEISDEDFANKYRYEAAILFGKEKELEEYQELKNKVAEELDPISRSAWRDSGTIVPHKSTIDFGFYLKNKEQIDELSKDVKGALEKYQESGAGDLLYSAKQYFSAYGYFRHHLSWGLEHDFGITKSEFNSIRSMIGDNCELSPREVFEKIKKDHPEIMLFKTVPSPTKEECDIQYAKNFSKNRIESIEASGIEVDDALSRRVFRDTIVYGPKDADQHQIYMKIITQYADDRYKHQIEQLKDFYNYYFGKDFTKQTKAFVKERLDIINKYFDGLISEDVKIDTPEQAVKDIIERNTIQGTLDKYTVGRGEDGTPHIDELSLMKDHPIVWAKQFNQEYMYQKFLETGLVEFGPGRFLNDQKYWDAYHDWENATKYGGYEYFRKRVDLPKYCEADGYRPTTPKEMDAQVIAEDPDYVKNRPDVYARQYGFELEYKEFLAYQPNEHVKNFEDFIRNIDIRRDAVFHSGYGYSAVMESARDNIYGNIDYNQVKMDRALKLQEQFNGDDNRFAKCFPYEWGVAHHCENLVTEYQRLYKASKIEERDSYDSDRRKYFVKTVGDAMKELGFDKETMSYLKFYAENRDEVVKKYLSNFVEDKTKETDIKGDPWYREYSLKCAATGIFRGVDLRTNEEKMRDEQSLYFENENVRVFVTNGKDYIPNYDSPNTKSKAKATITLNQETGQICIATAESKMESPKHYEKLFSEPRGDVIYSSSEKRMNISDLLEVAGTVDCTFKTREIDKIEKKVGRDEIFKERDPFLRDKEVFEAGYRAAIEFAKIENEKAQEKAENLDKLNFAIENHPDEQLAVGFSQVAEKMIEWTETHTNEKGELIKENVAKDDQQQDEMTPNADTQDPDTIGDDR